MLVPWGRFPLCHTPIKPISAFRDQISILIVGCVTTWSWGSHQWLPPWPLTKKNTNNWFYFPYFLFYFFIQSSPWFVSINSSGYWQWKGKDEAVIFGCGGSVSGGASSVLIWRGSWLVARQYTQRWVLGGRGFDTVGLGLNMYPRCGKGWGWTISNNGSRAERLVGWLWGGHWWYLCGKES